MKGGCNVIFNVEFLEDVKITPAVINPKTITANGIYDASEEDADGYNPITVNVPNVIPDGYVKPTTAQDITENGTYDVTEVKTVHVNVETGGTGEDTEMVYTFKDDPTFPLGKIEQNIRFKSNGTNFVKMIVEPYYIEYVKSDGSKMLVYSEHDISGLYGAWEHPDWMTVNLGTGEQTMDAEFYAWFIANVTEAAKKGLVVLQKKSVTPTASEQIVTADIGYDGLSEVRVGASSSGGGDAKLGTLQVAPSANGQTINASDRGYDGFSKVEVSAVKTAGVNISANGTYLYNDLTSADDVFPESITVNVPSSGITPSGNKSITENGTFDVRNYATVTVTVDVPTGGDANIPTVTLNFIDKQNDANVIEYMSATPDSGGTVHMTDSYGDVTDQAVGGSFAHVYTRNGGSCTIYLNDGSSYVHHYGSEGAYIRLPYSGTATITLE